MRWMKIRMIKIIVLMSEHNITNPTPSQFVNLFKTNFCSELTSSDIQIIFTNCLMQNNSFCYNIQAKISNLNFNSNGTKPTWIKQWISIYCYHYFLFLPEYQTGVIIKIFNLKFILYWAFIIKNCHGYHYAILHLDNQRWAVSVIITLSWIWNIHS